MWDVEPTFSSLMFCRFESLQLAQVLLFIAFLIQHTGGFREAKLINSKTDAQGFTLSLTLN